MQISTPTNELLALSLIRDVPDFPQKGILFKDITPVLANPAAMRQIIDRFVEFSLVKQPTVIAGVESRGFVFGMPLALALELPFVPVRKQDKLPYRTIHEDYKLEYGTNRVEMHVDAVHSLDRVIIVDDLLATGGTASASKRLVERLGGEVVGYCFLIELLFLHGRKKIEVCDLLSLIPVS